GRQVVGIDQDAASIEAARRQDPDRQIEFVCGDFLTYPFPPASFGLVSCVAVLHHMDAAAALARMGQLLAPGGSVVIVGLARSGLLDLPWDAAAVIANLGHRVAKGYWQHPSATRRPPPPTYRQIRVRAGEPLPDARYRRHLLWRYSLVWVRPAAEGGRELARPRAGPPGGGTQGGGGVGAPPPPRGQGGRGRKPGPALFCAFAPAG